MTHDDSTPGMMHTVYLSLGGNLPGTAAQFERALWLMRHRVGVIRRRSPWITTPASGVIQGDFLNGVVAMQTALTPEAVLNGVQHIEHAAGRIRWGGGPAPRILDIDILSYDRWVRRDPSLTLPHPRLLQRPFLTRFIEQWNPSLMEWLCHVGPHTH